MCLTWPLFGKILYLCITEITTLHVSFVFFLSNLTERPENQIALASQVISYQNFAEFYQVLLIYMYIFSIGTPE